jgi:RimJ/RimL family protein N-acetyltransferase
LTSAERTRLKDDRVVLIRPLEMADKEAVVGFYSSLPPAALKWALPPYDRARVERFFAGPEQVIGLVGIAGGKVVGHLNIFRFPSRMNHLGEVVIYISQDFQGQGLGTAMMEAGLNLAKARGLHRLQLTVIEDNKGAIRAYEKVGFQREGRKADAYRGEDGMYHDAVDMGIILGGGP